ncbi:dienelactone hydrolase family protein [Marinomonas sp. C2222]|uniref:Dienelactone hydrolase family protein n=1 Tax=Marinomonas sargassi TaxID=2984494 RepID=A0ABT2YSB3_9GAMM|nr:alpha/beta family hydrolase [Marinomonas sargassi]MCV2402795.1 dienelactone hydrolase family protein [Marinomonas sargassi]
MIEPTLFVAHGSGAGHSTPFLNSLITALEQSNTSIKQVTPVTFSYMEQQEKEGKKRPPPRIDKLIPEYQNIVGNDTCIVAGKSLGGRVATQLSCLPNVKAIVCFGFPFHPPGKQEKHRLSFIQGLKVPCLIIQGTRDKLGNYEWVNQQAIPNNVDIIWIEGADHDFKTLKSFKKNQMETVFEIAEITKNWLKKTVGV